MSRVAPPLRDRGRRATACKLHPNLRGNETLGIKMATAVALSPGPSANAHSSPLRQLSQSRPTGLRRLKPKGTSLLYLVYVAVAFKIRITNIHTYYIIQERAALTAIIRLGPTAKEPAPGVFAPVYCSYRLLENN